MIAEYRDWKFIPDLILEQIFCYLSCRDRLSASCTCIPWNQTFYNPCLWKKYIYIPPLYLEKYSQRYHYDMATYNLSKCFKNIGYSFQTIIIPPISDFFILNRALNVMSDFYYKHYKRYNTNDEINPLCDYRSKLEVFSFEFDSQTENGSTYGTGGTLLISIKKLIGIICNLKSVRLKSLLLTSEDRIGLLDEFVRNNKESLIKLSLVDISKSLMPEFEIVNFTNLKILELSFFQMCPDLLVNLIQETKVEIIILTQTRFSLFSEEFASIQPIPSYVWELVNDLNPNLKIHQRYNFNNISEFIDQNTISIIYQPKPAPITLYSFISNNISLLDLYRLEQYHQTLTEIIIVVDSATDSTIRNTIDDELLSVVLSCPNLTTLILGGQRLSVHSSTILYLLHEITQAITHLYIHINTVQYSIENISSNMFYSSLSNDLIAASSDRDLFRLTVSAHLKVPTWNLLNDEQFFHFVDKYEFVDCD